MRDDSGALPGLVLVFLSLTLVVACYLMSLAPQPTAPGLQSSSASGSESCTSYFGTTFDCSTAP
jgi:hypothetical protein